MSHLKPRVGDHVYSSYRDQYGRNPLGKVIRIKWSDEEVVVKFFGDMRKWHPAMVAMIKLHEPQWANGGGEVDTFSFDEFVGCWSSHDGGDGEWKIGG